MLYELAGGKLGGINLLEVEQAGRDEWTGVNIQIRGAPAGDSGPFLEEENRGGFAATGGGNRIAECQRGFAAPRGPEEQTTGATLDSKAPEFIERRRDTRGTAARK